MTAEIYLESWRKQDGISARIIRLQFCKIANWRVYEYTAGRTRNWEVTVGRGWKTDIEAKNFLKQLGWEPVDYTIR